MHSHHRLMDLAPLALKQWLKTQAQRAELHNLPPNERQRVLQETGFSEYDIDHLEADHPGPQVLLPQRLQAAGIDAKELSEKDPSVLRDLERTCSRCGEAARCQRDLQHDGANDKLAGYCPNTGTVDYLIEGKTP